MGAPKQKWTSEEEAALKAGVVKHGSGKWRTILKDPEYSSILSLRSNVDLKDKWRNMSVTANGWGSREKARMALRRSQHTYRSDEESSECPDLDSDEEEEEEEIVGAKPLTISNGMLQIASPKQSGSRLENLIIEAITSLKEPSGSNKTNIAMYIEDQYNTPPNFKRILSAKLKGLATNGKLIKVNRKYRIAPSAIFSQVRRNSVMPVLEGRHKEPVRVEKDDIRNLMKSQIDAELAKMRTMSVQEAAAAAARAVAEAEAAMAEAEEAAKEAEAAEADADAAQAFAEAAMTTLKNRYTTNLMVHG
ncbi:hypothetical protein AQUCO_00400181v1 [Aquilegia coerulea]|uniref:MYB transcription factor n=1 Tax=Aquilegia coerulea TaxID=218851 RepID=A0A2G5ETR8_AQUCA|nr:hypothetical protein AQUCO_00400181v1 [Aquilegia coerulea]PIA59143.1 hypothetical protein AQUCO_00400181v1 [Aquilegia coerulea]